MSDGKRGPSATEVLAAAARVFAERGYRGATMQSIAAAAGCTVPTLYTHFEGKQGILRGLIEKVVGELLDFFEQPMPAGLTLAQSLELLHQRQFAWLETQREAIAFLMSMPEAVREAHLELPDGPTLYIEHLTPWLEAHAGPDDLGCSIEEAAYVLWGVSHAFFLRWLHAGGRDSLVDQAGDMVRIYLGGVAA